jgi:voltage-gated potassium channel Kch
VTIVGGLGVVAFVLGTIGFADLPFGDRLYTTIQLFSLGSSGQKVGDSVALQIARWLAPATTAYAGLRALSVLFRDQVARFRLRFGRSRHVVVCGLGRSGVLLARSFDQRRDRVVVIEKDPSNGAIAECTAEGIIVMVGDATDSVLLGDAGVGKAGVLIAVCGDDGVNASVAMAARAVPRAGGRRRGRGDLRLLVQIDDVELCRMLNERAVGSAVEFLNVTESAPPALLAEFAPTLAAGGAPPHLVVAGMGTLGRRLVAHAARQWKVTQPSGSPPMQVTVVDTDATGHRQALIDQLPDIEQVCRLVAHDVDPSSSAFARHPPPLATPTAVFVCLDDDARSLRTALAVRAVLRATPPPAPASIVVCTTGQAGLADLLGSADDPGIHGFSLLERACRAETVLNGVNEVLARTIHEDYVRTERAAGSTPATNPSMVDWDRLPEPLRESNRDQARDIARKLAVVGCEVAAWTDWDAAPVVFTDEEVERLARLEHDRWMQEKLDDGWEAGPIEDRDGKVHPALVPWDQLTDDVKDLDRNPVRAIPVTLVRAGLTVVRGPGGSRRRTDARLRR